MKIASADYIISAYNSSQFPQGHLPEIAFAGRSNVGKSSLLNCLVGRDVAKISGTPGKTRAINFFLINRNFYFVDLPGYGYARVSKEMQQAWRELIEGYIGNRPNLRAIVLIIDARREQIPPADLQMIDYILSVRVLCVPVLTKIDKLSHSELARIKKTHFSQFPAGFEPILFSAVTREGLAELQKQIAHYLAQPSAGHSQDALR